MYIQFLFTFEFKSEIHVPVTLNVVAFPWLNKHYIKIHIQCNSCYFY